MPCQSYEQMPLKLGVAPRSKAMADKESIDAAIVEGSVITEIRRLTQSPNNISSAKSKLTEFLERKFEFKVLPDTLIFDVDNALALNSLRAQFRTQDGQHLFLKCHHEEGEASRVGEYYRSGILEQAGFPIETALYHSSTVGEQMVIYAFRDRKETPELHSVARRIEENGCLVDEVLPVAKAFNHFQQRIGKRYLSTLHLATPSQVAAESVHGLFHRRLVDHEQDQFFGARIRSFYLGRVVSLPDNHFIPFEKFWHMRWCINGRHYDLSLHSALLLARNILKPTTKHATAAVTAHGDDHTGNMLYDSNVCSNNAIMYFDPAFAGRHIPALLAPCKALYHICFAHPNMLYNPDELDIDISCNIVKDTIHVSHNWELSPLRQHFLQSQLENVWRPLLHEMQKNNMLPACWKETIGSALVCCPILCKNIISGLGAPNPLTNEASLLTFSIAVQLAAGDLGNTNETIQGMLPNWQ